MTRGWKLDRGIQHCPRGEERKLGVRLKMGRLRGRWEYRRVRGWRVGLDDGDVSLLCATACMFLLFSQKHNAATSIFQA